MKRTLTLSAAWSASAVAAVGLGFLAVSLVDASASPGDLATSSSTRLSAVTATAPAPSAPTSAATSALTSTAAPADNTAVPGASAPQASVEHATAGGSVLAGCSDGTPVLASAPSPGWWIDDSSSGNEVEFENGSESIEVTIDCATGTPQFSVEGPRADG
ncbi:MAG: hypothetical protein ACJ71Y_00510 [Blastococcus sp.]